MYIFAVEWSDEHKSMLNFSVFKFSFSSPLFFLFFFCVKLKMALKWILFCYYLCIYFFSFYFFGIICFLAWNISFFHEIKRLNWNEIQGQNSWYFTWIQIQKWKRYFVYICNVSTKKKKRGKMCRRIMIEIKFL